MMKMRSVRCYSGLVIGVRRVGSSFSPAARRAAVTLAAACVFAAQPTSAEVITFQDQPVGPYPGDSVLIAAGAVTVRFTGIGLQIRDISGEFPPQSSRVLSTTGDARPITATFTGGFTTDFVQIRNWISGIYTGEVDTITMYAFDASHALLGSVTGSNEFISLAFPGIALLTFDDFENGVGYVIDDFAFNAQPVPEPASLLLVGTAAAGLIASRRKRKRELHSHPGDGNPAR